MSNQTVTSLVLQQPPALTEHPALVYLSGLAPGSVATMKQALNLIAHTLTDGKADYLTFNWAALRYKHTAALRAALIQNYEPATVNKMLCALRRVLKEALLLELISPTDYTRAININSIKATKELRGRALTQDEINSLMKVCVSDRTNGGYRDAALIAILRCAGLRRAEVVNLNLVDFHPLADGELKIIAAKGRVDRTVYIPPSAISIVNNWIEARTNVPGPLLCTGNKAGKVG
uniref:tyrosine-type recombinase/integrase n=1 Tax=Aetokthonos hydrillicola TaxID=1550245 RepID=UPI001ABB9E15